MINKEQIFNLIQKHQEGLDDDDISKMAGIKPRQQVQQRQQAPKREVKLGPPQRAEAPAQGQPAQGQPAQGRGKGKGKP